MYLEHFQLKSQPFSEHAAVSTHANACQANGNGNGNGNGHSSAGNGNGNGYPLALLASLTQQELARQVAYLKAENQLLRNRLQSQFDNGKYQQLKINPYTGYFSFTGSPELPCNVQFTTERNEFFVQGFDYHPEGTANLGECEMRLDAHREARAWALQNPQSLPLADHPHEEVAKILKELESDRFAKSKFEADLNKHLKEQKKWTKHGHRSSRQ